MQIQNKKVFECNCACSIYRGDIRLQFKGEKGKLRKLVLQLIEQYPAQAAPPQPIKLKQPTLQQVIQRQNPVVEKETLRPLNMKAELLLYAGDELLITFPLMDVQSVNNNSIHLGKLTFTIGDKVAAISECPGDILQMLYQAVQKTKEQIKNFYNTAQPKQNQEQISQSSYRDAEKQIPKPDPRLVATPFYQPVALAKQRKLMASRQPDHEPPQRKQPLPAQQPQNYLVKSQTIPSSVLSHILRFQDLKGLFKYRVVNKHFESVINGMIQNLNFAKFVEVPFELMMRCLRKFQGIQKLSFGQMRNIKVGQLQEAGFPKLFNIQIIDFGDYLPLTDKSAQKVLTQTEGTKTVILPYHSKITNTTLNLLNTRYSNLTSLKLKEHQKSTLNEQLTSAALAALLIHKELIFYKIATVQSDFFEECLKQSTESPIILKQFKIGTLIQPKPQIAETSDFLEFLCRCQNLSKLTVKAIIGPNSSNLKANLIFHKNFFAQLSTLQFISFGQFVDDAFCEEVTKLENLKGFKFRSRQVTDTGIKKILSKLRNLQTIDIATCSSVAGHCFEELDDKAMTLLFPKIDIIVSFDDYSLQCLEELLQARAYDYKLKNVQLRQK